MKKHVLVLLFLAGTFMANSENLTLIPVNNGPEHGTLRKYIMVGSDQVNKVATESEIKYHSISDTIISTETKTTARRYLGEVFFIGNDFDEKAVIAAAGGEKKIITKEETEEEAGYTHWGFIKNYQIKTPSTTYELLSKSPLIVSAQEKINYASQGRFHFGSVVALVALLLFGFDLGILFFRGPKRWWVLQKQNGFDFTAIALASEIYSLFWSFYVGMPFLFLAIGCLFPGIIIIFRETFFHKKEVSKEPAIIESPSPE